MEDGFAICYFGSLRAGYAAMGTIFFNVCSSRANNANSTIAIPTYTMNASVYISINLKLSEPIIVARAMISITEMVYSKEVFFSISIIELDRLGTALIAAWGTTIRSNACSGGRFSDLIASRWPSSTV